MNNFWSYLYCRVAVESCRVAIRQTGVSGRQGHTPRRYSQLWPSSITRVTQTSQRCSRERPCTFWLGGTYGEVGYTPRPWNKRKTAANICLHCFLRLFIFIVIFLRGRSMVDKLLVSKKRRLGFDPPHCWRPPFPRDQYSNSAVIGKNMGLWAL